MNLLIYGINYAPELTGIGKYSGEMAAWLAARGHEVTVVTAPPYYPEWRIHAGHPNRYSRTARQTGSEVEVWRAPLWVPRRVNGRNRLLHLLSFALTSVPALVRAMHSRRPDVVFMVAPTLMTAPAALVAGWLWRRPVWLHVQDFEVDAMLGMGVVAAPRGVAGFARAVERFLMRRFDRVSSISRRMCERLVEKGVPKERVIEFPNWVDLSSIQPLAGPNPYREHWGIGANETLVLYAGNLGEKQGIEVLIDVARRLEDRPDIRFVIAGEGAARARLQESADGLGAVRWLPLQPAERLNELLNAADIHVLPQRADAADLVMPSKLTGMLASGRATVGTAGDQTQLGGVLDRCGVRVAPEDGEALAQAIVALADDPARREGLGHAGRAFAVDTMARDAILRHLEGALQAVAPAQ